MKASALIFLTLLLAPGCSVKKFAIRQVGASLNSGPSVFETDEDIELVGDALPFSLKFVESLLAEVPNDRNLLITAARGFTLYSYAYVDYEAEKAYDVDLVRSRRLRERAVRLYLRAARYGFRALERLYPGFEESLSRNPAAAVLVTRPKKAKRDVPLLYWTAASLGLAISNAKDDANMLARIEEVEALIGRAIALDDDWDDGALHEFQVTFSGSKPGPIDEEKVSAHYRRALELNGGRSAGLFVSYAEALAVPTQDVGLFREMLKKALAVDPDLAPDHRLLNLLAQRRARWLEARTADLFLIVDEAAQ